MAHLTTVTCSSCLESQVRPDGDSRILVNAGNGEMNAPLSPSDSEGVTFIIDESYTDAGYYIPRQQLCSGNCNCLRCEWFAKHMAKNQANTQQVDYSLEDDQAWGNAMFDSDIPYYTAIKRKWMKLDVQSHEGGWTIERERDDRARRRMVNQRKRRRKLASKLMKQGVVYEFGFPIDFSEINICEDLLTEYRLWIEKRKFLNFDIVKRDACKYFRGKPWRQIAFAILRGHGCVKADVFLSMFEGCSKDDYAKLVNQTNVQVGPGLLAAGAFFSISAFLVGKYGRRIDDSIRSVRTISDSAAKVSSAMDCFSGVAGSVKEACKKVYEGICAFRDLLVDTFMDLPEIARDLCYYLALLFAVLVGIEFTKLFFGDWIGEIWTYLKGTLGIEYMPPPIKRFVHNCYCACAMCRAGSSEMSCRCDHSHIDSRRDSGGKPLELCRCFYQAPDMEMKVQSGKDDQSSHTWVFKFFRKNFLKMDRKTFDSLAGSLPKAKNVCQSVEYFFKFFKDRYYDILSWWTGIPHGKGADDKDKIRVCDLSKEITRIVKRDLVDEISSTDLEKMFSEANELIEKQMPIRTDNPVVGSSFARAVENIASMHMLRQKTIAACEARAVPILVWIMGKSGQKKSSSLYELEALTYAYVREHGKAAVGKRLVSADSKFGYDKLYIFNEKEPYADRYQGQFFEEYDDAFQCRGTETRQAAAVELIHKCTPNPYGMLVATPELKGRVFYRSRAIFLTTNMGSEGNEKSIRLDGKDLGLTSHAALEGRRNVIVWVELNSFNEPTFEILPDDPSQGHGIDGGRQKMVTIEELAGLIGEMIFQRELDVQKAIDPPAPPRFYKGYKSSRITIEPKYHLQPHSLTPEEREFITNGTVDGKNPTRLANYLRKQRKAEASYQKEKETEDGKDKGKERLKVQGKEVFVFSKKMKNFVRDINSIFAEIDDLKDYEVPAMLETIFYDVYYRCIAYHTDGWSNTRRENYLKLGFQEFCNRCDSRFVLGHWKDRLFLDSSWLFKKFSFLEKYINEKAVPKMTEPLTFWLKFLTHSFPMIPSQVLYTALYQSIIHVNLMEYVDPMKVIDVEYWISVFGQREIIPVDDDRIPWKALFLGTGCVAGFLTGAILLKAGQMFFPSKSLRDDKVSVVQGTSYHGPTKTVPTKTLVRSPRTNQLVRVDTHVQDSHGRYNNICTAMDKIHLMWVPTGTSTLPERFACDSFMIWLGKGLALLPSHTILGLQPPEGHEAWVKVNRHFTQSWRLSDLGIKKMGENDLAFVYFPNLPTNREFSPNFYKNFAEGMPDIHDDYDVVFPTRHTTGLEVYEARGGEFIREEHIYREGYPRIQTDISFNQVYNFAGMCGAPYVHRRTGEIVAIHMAGNEFTRRGACASVFRGDIDLDKILSEFKIQSNVPDFVVEHQYIGTLEECTKIPGVITVGKTDNQHSSYVPNKTALHLSSFDWLSLCRILGVPDTTDMPGILHASRDIQPLKNALSRFSVQECVTPPPPAREFYSFLPKGFDRSKLWILSKEQAIYGVPGRIKSLPNDTSLGYFYKKLFKNLKLTRRDLFYEYEPRDGTYFPRIHPILDRNLDIKIEKFRNKICVPVFFEETLKDELKPLEKVQHPRLFSSGDLDSLIIQKMYLGSLIAEASKDPTRCPCSGGLNAHSGDWGRLYSWLRGEEASSRPRLLRAGDFSKFDISLKNDVLADFITFILRINPEPTITVLIVLANFLGYHIVGVFVFFRPWGTSSGAYITFFFNSFGNWNIHKRAFVALFSEEEWHVVHCSFTGDDSILTVPQEYAAYDMAYLQKFFWDKWRMSYTSPFKDESLEVTWENVTYLKRRFEVGHMGVMAPLAINSIINCVKWTDAKAFDKEIMTSVLNSVLLEAFHYGRNFYQKCYDWVMDEEVRLGELFEVPDWNAMVEMRRKDYVL